LLVIFIYTNSDRVIDKNSCEKLALKEISESKDSIIELDYDCPVLAWDRILKPEESELNGQLLNIWRITKERKLYYNK
jgi:hypothetical protein